jgi:hypothetical protein
MTTDRTICAWLTEDQARMTIDALRTHALTLRTLAGALSAPIEDVTPLKVRADKLMLIADHLSEEFDPRMPQA